jgi:hypothetical protein
MPSDPNFRERPAAEVPMNPMKSSSNSTSLLLRVSLNLLLASGLAACSDDTPGAVPKVDGGGSGGSAGTDGGIDAAAGAPAVSGGEIPAPPDGAVPAPISVDADYTTETKCCPVELSLADATGDETTARVLGDAAGLDAAGGLPLAWSAGRWRATVCLPLDTLLTYRFYFGAKTQAPATPVGDVDVDAGAMADAGVTPAPDAEAPFEPPTDDAGVPIEAGVDPTPAPADAAPITVEDYRTSSEAPAVVDLDGVGHNLYAPISSCNTIPPDTTPPPPKE